MEKLLQKDMLETIQIISLKLLWQYLYNFRLYNSVAVYHLIKLNRPDPPPFCTKYFSNEWLYFTWSGWNAEWHCNGLSAIHV